MLVQVLPEEQGTFCSAVTIENGVISDTNLIVHLEILLDAESILIVLTLSDVADNARVKALNHKFKRADTECTSGFQILAFIRKQT